MFHQHIPDGDDVADGASEDEEVEHGVHILRFIEGIKHGSRDVTDTFGNQPDDGSRLHRVHQRLKGHKDTQSHAHETEGLYVRVLL